MNKIRGKVKAIFRPETPSPESPKKIYEIYPRWDSFPDPNPKDDKRSFFSGRNDLVSKLKHWIVYSGGGSVLVSGSKGVGKTSFVYHSINQANYISSNGDSGDENKSSKKITFIPINAATCLSNHDSTDQAQNGANGKNIKTRLLSHIIEALHHTGDDKFKEKIEKLYLSALSIDTTSTTEEREKILEQSTKKISKVPFIIFLVSSFILFLPIFFPNFPYLQRLFSLIPKENMLKISYLLLMPFPVQFFVTISKSKEKTEKITAIYKYDDPDYLLHKIKEILSNTDDIFVFVIDELDKLKGVSLNDLVVIIKNLLTISSGRFIFITDDNYYSDEEQKIKSGKDESSTFYTWKLFLPAVTISDIVDFISSITKIPIKKSLKREFSYYLFAETGGNFLKIKDLLRDFIYIKDNTPYLNLEPERFGKKEKRISRMCKLFYLEYQKNNNPLKSREHSNHIRFSILYPAFTRIIDKTKLTAKSISGWLQEGAKKQFQKLEEWEKASICEEFIDILKQIAQRAAGDKELSFPIPLENYEEEFEFDFDMAQVLSDSRDLSEMSERNTGLAEKYKKTLELFKNKIDSYSNNLGKTTKGFLNIIDKDAFPMFEAAESIYNDIVPGSFTDPDKIQNYSTQIKKISGKIDMSKLELVVDYLQKWFFEETRLIQGSEFDKKLKLLPRSAKTILKYNSKMIEIQGNYVLLTEHLGLGINIFTRKIKNVVDKNLYFICSSKTTRSQLIRAGVDPLKILNVSFGKHLREANTITTSLRGLFDLTNNKGVFPDEIARPVPENVPWQHYSIKTSMPKGKFVKKIRFRLKTSSDYWRAGMIFGPKDDNFKLADGQHPLVHIFKQAGNNNIGYRMMPSSNSKTKNRGENSINNVEAEKEIEVRIEKQARSLKLFINDIEIDSIPCKMNYLKRGFLLAWGDGHDFEVEFKNILFEFSS